MQKTVNEDIIQRAKKIKLLVTDVDGVLTDASMNFFNTPEGKTVEIKRFCAYDGIAVHMLRDFGIKTAIITGGNAPSTEFRAKSLGMDYLYYNFLSKLPPLEDIIFKTGLDASQIAYIGDDLIDIPPLKNVGLACATQSAVLEVKEASHFITNAEAGQGCYREVVELILKAQGLWEEVLSKAAVGELGVSLKKKTEVINYKTWAK